MPNFSVLKILPGYEEQYQKSACERHLRLFFPLTCAIFIAEVLLLFFQYIRLGPELFDLLYFYVYIVATLVSGVFLLVYRGYRKGKLQRNQNRVDIAFVACFFLLAILTALAETDATQSQSLIFITFSFFVSTLLYFNIHTTILMIVMGNSVLIISILLLFPFSWDVKFGLVLNYIFLLLANLFLIYPFHNSRIQAFNQELELERANSTLKRTNLRLEMMNKQLEETSVTDALTGILNRLAFNKALELSWEQALLVNDELAVIMLDTDYFKRYNDHFGHLEGDRCLKLIAHTIQQCLKRSADHVFRYGGEEFVVLLPGNSAQGAETVAKRILSEIENLAIAQDLPGEFVTLSAGVHGMSPSKNSNMFELVDKADKALYHAKNNGRNQVSVYDALPSHSKELVPPAHS